MKKMRFLVVVVGVLFLLAAPASALTYWEAYNGTQYVSEYGSSYDFGFDFWETNDVYDVGTNSNLALTHDASGMSASEIWTDAELFMTFSSHDHASESASLTLTPWDASGNPTGDEATFVFDFAAGGANWTYENGLWYRVVNPTSVDFEYQIMGDLVGKFAEWGWGNVNIAATVEWDWSLNNFAINSVGMGVTTQSVPEPGTIVLMGLGLVGLAGMGRKKYLKK